MFGGFVTKFSVLAAKVREAAAAVAANRLWAWGWGSDGSASSVSFHINEGVNGVGNVLGLGFTGGVDATFTNVNNTDEWIMVDNGSTLSAGIKGSGSSGTLWAWGRNVDGQLGQGNVISRNSPVQIGTASDWTKIQVGKNVYRGSWLGLKSDGTIWFCGYSVSSIGLSGGASAKFSSPVQLGTDSDWRDISFEIGEEAFAIKTNNTLWAWGLNSGGGNLGISGAAASWHESPTAITGAAGLSAWSDVCGGMYQILAIGTDGTLWGWGQGDPTGWAIKRASTPQQIGSGTNWSQITESVKGGMLLKTDGTLWGWGQNDVGQLGRGNTTSNSSPVQVGADTTWARLSENRGHSHMSKFNIAIKTDGTMWSWGDNNFGQLGLGLTTGTTGRRSSPVQIGTDTDWIFVHKAPTSAFAIKNNGTLWAWGNNLAGDLGLGDTVHRSVPVQVGGLTGWKHVSTGFDSYSYSQNHPIFAVLAVGPTSGTAATLWSWGNGQLGRRGSGNSTNVSSPVQVGALTDWDKIIGGLQFGAVFARRHNNTIWNWGTQTARYGALASLPIGQIAYPGYMRVNNSPVQTTGLSTGWTQLTCCSRGGGIWKKESNSRLYVLGERVTGTFLGGCIVTPGIVSSPSQVSGTNWSKVVTTHRHHIGLKKDNTLWAWGGFNKATDLGLNTNGRMVSAPTQISGTWNNVAVTSNRSTIVAGGVVSMCATRTNGTIWSWGYNNNGQLGHNNATSRSSPVQIGALTDWTMGPTGGIYGGSQSFMAKKNYKLWAWGRNQGGQLGASASNIGTIPNQMGTDANWDKLTVNSTFCLSIKTTGALFGWGPQTSGQLGNGNTTTFSSPVQVGALTDWTNVVLCYRTAFARKTDGSLWTWGLNDSGQLGNGTTGNRSSPVQLGSDLTWFDGFDGMTVQTGASTKHFVAIKNAGGTAGATGAGTLWAWGANASGQLGDGTATSRSSPVQIGTDNTWLRVFLGQNTTFAIKADGSLWAWGANDTGQLGLRNTTVRSSPVQVGTGTDWVSVGTARAGSTFAIKTNGTLWSWGNNPLGQLGLGDATNRSSPVQVGSGTTWSRVNGEKQVVQAITTDGQLWIWGGSPYGGPNFSQLPGHPSAVRASSPVQIGSTVAWKTAGTSSYKNFLIKTDNTLWTGGARYNGTLNIFGLGGPFVISRSSPALVTTDNSDWKIVSIGSERGGMGIKK